MIRILMAMLVLLGTSQLAASDSLRCGSRLIGNGALAAEVLGACGEPDYRDTWLVPQPYSGRYVSDAEEWYYNFGPSQLLRILRFRNGKLVDVGSDGYGYMEPPGPPDCEPAEIVEGLSKFRLLLRCGEPVTRESVNVLRPLRDPQTGAAIHRYQEPVFREKWVYNFGSRYFLRIVTLENGRVTDVEQGSRGS